MDLGIQFTDQEEEEMRIAALRELAEEGELAKMKMKMEAEAKVALEQKDKQGAGEPELFPDPGTNQDGQPDGNVSFVDETYGSDSENENDDVKDAGEPGAAAHGADADQSALDSAGSTPPESLVNESFPSGASTPLEYIEEQDETDETLGDDDSMNADNTPEGSADAIQTDSELAEELDGPLPSDDGGLSRDEMESQEREINRKIVKLELKALRKEAFAKMKEGGGEDVPAEGEGRGFAL
jgi:hypothetical protein